MAVALRREKLYTPEEYLALEETAEYKSEYFKGQIFAMAGGSANHSRIVSSVNALLFLSLRGRGCETFNSDMRLLVKANGLYTYPDAMVVCGKPAFLEGRTDTLTNPIVIVEVLSKSTQDYDRGQKFELYRALPTLQEYVIIHQDRVYIEHYRKLLNGRWELSELTEQNDLLLIHSLKIELSLPLIYERADWLAA
jgi:Uma2 family endonuclease